MKKAIVLTTILVLALFVYGTASVNQPPVCDANGAYEQECTGTTNVVSLDGSGSIDPDGDALTYSWITDCSGGTFDDSTSSNPNLSVSYLVAAYGCTVTLEVNDGQATDTCSSTVTVVDTTPPSITCPADISVEATGPTGAQVSFTPVVTPGVCDELGVFFECNYTPGDTFAIGTTFVQCNGVDMAGNYSEACSFQITVTPINVSLDIQPGSCPNSFNLHKKGLLAIAILGTADFDVTLIDPMMLKLQDSVPIMWDIEDVATPFNGVSSDDCFDCTTLGGDGFNDLTVKFKAQDVAGVLGPLEDGTCEPLTLKGILTDGTEIEGVDYIIIRNK